MREATQVLQVVFGANGGSGRALIDQVLAAGDEVRAVTRHPEDFGPPRPVLEVVRGDVMDAASVARCTRGADAVLSALGVPYTRHPVTTYSAGVAHVLEGMQRADVRRIVAVTSTAIGPDGGRQGDLVTDRVISPFIHRIGRTVYEDMRRMEDLLRASGAEWTIVRPAALADAPGPGRYIVSTGPVQGRFTTRQDLAASMLDAAANGRFVREAVQVVSPDARPNLLGIIWRDGIRKR